MYVLDVEVQQVKFGCCFEFEILEVRHVWATSKWKNKNHLAAEALRGLKTLTKYRMILKEAERQQKKVQLKSVQIMNQKGRYG